MNIVFAAVPSATDALILPVAKGALDAVIGSHDGKATLAAAAAAAKFEGEAGGVVEAFVGDGGSVQRTLLVGVGDNGEADWEKAGGAVTARLLTNAKDIAIDLSSAKPSAAAAARFAAAIAQRGWRIDTYRTKLPEKQKPQLATVTIAGASDGTDKAWGSQEAVTTGLDLTRTLVAEPPNIVYPASFVERVTAAVDGLGLEITVLGPKEMGELGMGALLASHRALSAKAVCSRSNGAARGRAIPTWRSSARA